MRPCGQNPDASRRGRRDGPPESGWRVVAARLADRLSLGAHGRVLARGTAQALAALTAFRLALFLRLFAKTRLLSPADMGRLTLATSIAMVIFVATDGFPHALLRFASVLRGEAEMAGDDAAGRARAKGLSLLTYRIAGLFAAGLLALTFAVADPVAVAWFRDARLGPLIKTIAVGAVFYMVTRLNVALLGSRYKVVYEHAASAAEVLGMLAIVLAAQWVPHRLPMFAFAYSAANAAVAAASFAVLRREMPFLFDRRVRPEPCRSPVVRFAMLSAVTATARRLREEVNIAIIALFLPPEQIALYNVAGQIGVLPNELVRGVNTILGPVAGSLYGKRDVAAVRRLHVRTGAMMAVVAACGVAVFAAAGRPLLSLFGAYYRQAFGPLLVIAASTVVTSAAGSVEIIINMSGRPHWNTANQIALLVLLVGMSRCLVPCWGVAGAAVSFSASQAAIAVLSAAEMAWFYRKDQRAAEASDR